MEVHRYPRKERPGKDGRVPIRLMVHYHNKRLPIPTGEKVAFPGGWDEQKQVVKRGQPWAGIVNQKLANMEKVLRFVYQVSERRPLDNATFKHLFDQVFDRILASGVSSTEDDFTRGQIQKAYDAYLEDLRRPPVDPAPVGGFFDLFQKWIDWKANSIDEKTGKKLAGNTIDSFRYSMQKFKTFEKQRGEAIAFAGMDNTFYEEFQRFMLAESPGSLNTFGKLISHLKQFLSWCVDQNVQVNPKFLKFFVPSKYVGVDFLYQEELAAIKHIDYKSEAVWEKLNQLYAQLVEEIGYAPFSIETFKNQAELARDIFLMCCYTSLRISDANALEKSRIRNDIIVVKTMKKTSKPCYIPFFDDEIFEPVALVKKYESQSQRVFPRIHTSQVNFHLKIIQRLVGIDRLNLSTKIGRKTFTTLKIYQGVPRSIVMQATGHLTEVSFNRYLGVNEKELVEIFRKKAIAS